MNKNRLFVPVLFVALTVGCNSRKSNFSIPAETRQQILKVAEILEELEASFENGVRRIDAMQLIAKAKAAHALLKASVPKGDEETAKKLQSLAYSSGFAIEYWSKALDDSDPKNLENVHPSNLEGAKQWRMKRMQKNLEQASKFLAMYREKYPLLLNQN